MVICTIIYHTIALMTRMIAAISCRIGIIYKYVSTPSANRKKLFGLTHNFCYNTIKNHGKDRMEPPWNTNATISSRSSMKP